MALPDNRSSFKQADEISQFADIVELNVGGQVYITRYPTLISVPGSLLWEMFSKKNVCLLARDTKGRYFLDRDGFLFRYVLDYMRDQQLVLPEHFPERSRLQREAEYFKLPELVKLLSSRVTKQKSVGEDAFQNDSEEPSPSADVCRNLTSVGAVFTAKAGNHSTITDLLQSGFLTVGYRGSYKISRDSQIDAKFRRVARIMVCGRTSLAKEVFGDTLNESWDPDRPPERYTSRYYLKFTFLEQAFDRLADAGFQMVACNSTGTCSFARDQTDDNLWTSYTEYVFYRAGSSDAGQILHSTVLPPMETAEDITEESVSIPPPTSLEKQEQDSGKEFFSSSIDSHDSATDPIELPPQEHFPAPDLCISPHEENSLCPSMLALSQTFESNDPHNQGVVEGKVNGIESFPDPLQLTEERKVLEAELVKCIEEFQKIRIPIIFPNKKRHWQNELLSKYQL